MRFTVTDADTAAAWGSGDLRVLATPRLLAWLEAATLTQVPAAEHETSVGTRVTLEHLRPSGVGSVVEVRAEVTHRDGRLYRLQVSAQHLDGTQVATGEVTRVVVGKERFMSRVSTMGQV